MPRISDNIQKTYHFSWTQVRPSPCGSIGCTTVEASSTHSVTQLSRSIISVNDGVRHLTRKRVRKTIAISTTCGAVNARDRHM